MKLCALWLALVSISLSVGAWAQSDTLFIDQVRRLEFEPTEGFFLVNIDDKRVVRLPAMVRRLSGRPGDGDATALYGAVARLQLPGEVTSLSYSTVFLGRGSRTEFVPPLSIDLQEPRLRIPSTDKLREQLLQRKAVLGSWRMQIQAQDESLKRLRADAEVIGDFGRILDKKEEIERVKNDLVNVKRDIETLSRFVKLAQSRPAPSNQVGREAQLVKQLSEITQVSHAVELTELRRRASAEAELQRKLALIEATRQDDLGALTSELERLARPREKQIAAEEIAE